MTTPHDPEATPGAASRPTSAGPDDLAEPGLAEVPVAARAAGDAEPDAGRSAVPDDVLHADAASHADPPGSEVPSAAADDAGADAAYDVGAYADAAPTTDAPTTGDAGADDAPTAGADAADPDTTDADIPPGTPRTCPYLAAAGGGWRSVEPVRDHRCGALDPPAVVSLDKQRRLCLAPAHVRCATFAAARDARGDVLSSVPMSWEPERRFVRTTPVVLETGPRRSSRPAGARRIRLVEATVAVLVVVILLLAGWRILGGGASEPSPGASPAASLVAGGGSSTPDASGVVAASSAPDATPGGTGAEVSPAPSAPASVSPETSARPSPGASPAKRTYRVRAGDTLSAIAAKFNVTWQQIAKANKIKNPSTIHAGQVLIIPTPAP